MAPRTHRRTAAWPHALLRPVLFASLSLAGCATAAPPPAPPPVVAATVESEPERELRPADVAAFARRLVALAERNAVEDLTARTLTHRTLWAQLEPFIDDGHGIHRTQIGRSVEGREIYALEIGRGPVRVLLWSQMHGDEATATLALADLVRFFASNPNDDIVRRVRERLTIVLVPMLNPDGAQRRRRENARGIDVNRDARRQVSPEARALASVHARLSPQFGFNLHDQSTRTMEDGRVVAISLLAPPHEPKPTDLPTFTRAKQLAAVMRMAADALVDRRVTRYVEPYNPQAFGDAMQSWGTSTVLLETGSWEDDPGKEFLRQVNFALLLTALDAIATRDYARAPLDIYESLPGNRPAGSR